jgi:hypothetical protein
MRDVEEVLEGRIVSTQLGEFGNTGIIYGYISIDAAPGKNVVVKIDSYTHHENLEVGSYVIVKAAKLGMTDILVAKDVSSKQSTETTTRERIMATS